VGLDSDCEVWCFSLQFPWPVHRHRRSVCLIPTAICAVTHTMTLSLMHCDSATPARPNDPSDTGAVCMVLDECWVAQYLLAAAQTDSSLLNLTSSSE